MCVISLLAACGNQPAAPADANALIPVSLSQAGDAQAGALVYSQNGCVMCHATTTQKLVGPGLAGVMTAGGPTYPDGVDYGYALPNGQPRTEETIAAWIIKGGRGQIGMMPGRRLSEQELADVLAYLRTLSK
jgi:cytochrome c